MIYRNRCLHIYWLVIVLIVLSFLVIAVTDFTLGNSNHLFDPERSSKLGSFLGGVCSPILSTISIIILLFSIIRQSRERSKERIRHQFFKMMEYHSQRVDRLNICEVKPCGRIGKWLGARVNDLRGEHVFVELKRQIHMIYTAVYALPDDVFAYSLIPNPSYTMSTKQRMDTAYIIFYAGLDRDNLKAMAHELIYILPEHRMSVLKHLVDSLGIYVQRSHQSILSAYFRNMYYAIKLLDGSDLFDQTEKEELIAVYRSQLSNPELYVLVFNLISRFGIRWEESDFVYKYNFLSNVPFAYVEGVDLRQFFPIRYEYEDYLPT